MKSFLQKIAASFIGAWLTIISAAAILFVFCAAVISFFNAENCEPAGTQNAVPAGKTFLVIDISRGFSANSTYAQKNQGDGIFNQGDGNFGVLDTLAAIEIAKNDPEICGIFLQGSGSGIGFCAIQEIQAALERFKNFSKKPVVAYLQNPSFKDYFLALAADKIWLHPYAKIPVNGLASQGIYFKDALEKIGVGIQIVKVGEYKSAVEPLISNSMSEADKEQRMKMLSDVWESFAGTLETRRKIPAGTLNEISENVGLVVPEDAKKMNFVDEIFYDDEVVSEVTKLGEADEDEKTFRQISLSDYLKIQEIAAPKKIKAFFEFEKIDDSEKENQIAILHAEGEIVDGNGDSDQIGGDSFSALVREIRQNKNVKAVVLNVNSPGGSVYAAEKIRRELEILAAEKTLVVSFADVAASGGYWISTTAKKIFAQPLTTTGSIGVFGVLANFENLGKMLGISAEAVCTSPLAEIETFTRPKNETEIQILQKDVDEIYEIFLQKVAKARNRSRDEIAEVGEGRVWTGIAAREHGLVDEFGGLAAAIDFAISEAKLDPEKVNICQYPRPVAPFEKFLNFLGGDDSDSPFAKSISRKSAVFPLEKFFSKTWKKLRALNDPNGIYARIPWEFDAAE